MDSGRWGLIWEFSWLLLVPLCWGAVGKACLRLTSAEMNASLSVIINKQQENPPKGSSSKNNYLVDTYFDSNAMLLSKENGLCE